jgi:hypothetical protein
VTNRSIAIVGTLVVVALLVVIGWVSLAGKPDATANDPRTKEATEAGPVPSASVGGPNDKRIGATSDASR